MELTTAKFLISYSIYLMFLNLYIGLNYKNIIIKKDEFALDSFGKIVSEKSRLKILNYIFQKKSATVLDVNNYMGDSGTTSYYHLNMMYKAGMLNITSQGKLLSYYINEEYFKNVLQTLKKYK